MELKKSVDTPKRVKIAAHSRYHKRIYKAIIKEKDMDVVYKLQLSENAQRARLTKRSNSSELVIYMHLSIGLSDF